MCWKWLWPRQLPFGQPQVGHSTHDAAWGIILLRLHMTRTERGARGQDRILIASDDPVSSSSPWLHYAFVTAAVAHAPVLESHCLHNCMRHCRARAPSSSGVRPRAGMLARGLAPACLPQLIARA